MTIDFRSFNRQQLTSTNNFERKVLDFLKDWYSKSETVHVQTSGSTGNPKVFPVQKNKMRNSAIMTCDFLGLKEGETALLCLPVEYISGKMMIVRSIERKLSLRLWEPSVNPIDNLETEVDFCAMTPLQVENSLPKIHLVRKLIIGGAAVSEKLKSKIYNCLQGKNEAMQIFETYGMSETLSHIAMKEIFPTEQSSFKLLPGVEISTDERGCLRIYAPLLNPEILQTNDMVEIQDPYHFRFLGRFDNVINSGGAKIFPEQLENVVKKHVSNEVAFLGVHDEQLGQKLVLTIEGTQDDALVDTINKITFEKSFHRPKQIFFIQNFPRTPNGKVNRREILNLL